MHQKEDHEGIVEYHLCSQCKHFMSIPPGHHFRNWDTLCTERKKEFNRDGGLTSCPVWREK